MTQFGAAQKIVIVEDNLELSDIYKTRLELLGYSVFAAYDGIQALMVIRDEMPDLVLLDLMVPKKAGDQILEEMRESDWGKNIKVMIISNLNESEAPVGLRNLGIEGYAVKANLSNDQLDQLVDAILKPAGQVGNVVLQQDAAPQVSAAPHIEVPVLPADPYSGTRMQGATGPHASDLHITPVSGPVPAPVAPLSMTTPEPAIPITLAPIPVQPAPESDQFIATAPPLPPSA